MRLSSMWRSLLRRQTKDGFWHLVWHWISKKWPHLTKYQQPFVWWRASTPTTSWLSSPLLRVASQLAGSLSILWQILLWYAVLFIYPSVLCFLMSFIIRFELQFQQMTTSSLCLEVVWTTKPVLQLMLPQDNLMSWCFRLLSRMSIFLSRITFL